MVYFFPFAPLPIYVTIFSRVLFVGQCEFFMRFNSHKHFVYNIYVGSNTSGKTVYHMLNIYFNNATIIVGNCTIIGVYSTSLCYSG